MEIRSARLTLWLMDAEFLLACLRGGARPPGSGGPLRVPDDWLAEAKLIRLRLGQYRNDEAYRQWGLWAILEPASRAMLGHIGFHTPPDPPYLEHYAEQAIELGFTVFPGYRSRGFATEAVTALIGWASERGVRRFILSISPDNVASSTIAARLGFKRISRWQDEQDGPEDVYLLDRTSWPALPG